MRSRIIEQAKKMFLQHGYSRVRLDEMADNMAISKKTIYNHFKGKEELLYAVIDASKQQFDERISEIEETEQEFREQVLSILSLLGMWVSKIKLFVKDLQRSNPNAYQYIIEARKDLIVKHAIKIMQKGKGLGLIEGSGSSHLALFIFLATAEKVTDTDYHDAIPAELTKDFPANPADLFHEILKIIYQGIKKEE